GIGPAYVDRLAARVAHLLYDGQQVSQNLEGMVHITLHVEDRHTAGLGHFVDVAVAHAPVTLADGDAVIIPPVDLADLFGRVAVADLRRGRIDKRSMPA